MQEGRPGAGLRGGAPLQNLLRPVWLRAERVDEGGRSPGLREWHKCENANRSPKDRRWAEDRR